MPSGYGPFERFWDGQAKERAEAEPAQPATRLLHLRVMTDAQVVERMAGIIITALEDEGLDLVEQSEMRLCRPPKQNDGRVYLTFVPGGEL